MFVGWTGYGIKKHGLLLILKKNFVHSSVFLFILGLLGLLEN